jgi:hypothetical protein
MGISPPHPGSISLSIFSGPHCGARSMRHPEGGERRLKVSEGSRGRPKIHEGLQRSPKFCEDLWSLETMFRVAVDVCRMS